MPDAAVTAKAAYRNTTSTAAAAAPHLRVSGVGAKRGRGEDTGTVVCAYSCAKQNEKRKHKQPQLEQQRSTEQISRKQQ